MTSELAFAVCLVRCLLRDRQYKEARWLMDCVWQELTGEAPPLSLFADWMPEWYSEMIAASMFLTYARAVDLSKARTV